MEAGYVFSNAEFLGKNLYTSETQMSLTKWGLKDNLHVKKFRFDQEFKQINLEDFIRDFFCSPVVRAGLSGILMGVPSVAKEIKFELLDTTVTSMDFFDIIGKEGITAHNGYIRKSMEEFVDGIVVADRLREALIMEESEHYSIFTEKYRSEFIFHLFSRLCLGGSVCQYEDYIAEYLERTKLIYKDLISVGKDAESGAISVLTLALQIKSIDGIQPFPTKDKYQNFLYLLVDPPSRSITVLYHKWVDFWQN